MVSVIELGWGPFVGGLLVWESALPSTYLIAVGVVGDCLKFLLKVEKMRVLLLDASWRGGEAGGWGIMQQEGEGRKRRSVESGGRMRQGV